MSCDRKDRYTVHTPESWRDSLAARIGRVEDRGNEVEARLGMRPYTVSVVHTRWSGGRRGNGLEELVRVVPILPVPKITDLTGLTVLTTATQVTEAGQILLSKISLTYTEADLQAQGTSPADDVYYEITFLAGCSEEGGARRRFQVRSAAFCDAERSQWTVTLVRAHESRARNGQTR